MSFPLTFPEDPTFLPQQTRRPRSLFSHLRHPRFHRHHTTLGTQISTHPYPDPAAQPKPIYIYPGLLRFARDGAILLDNQCPAVLFKCQMCNHQPNSSSSQQHTCHHEMACSICLDPFTGKDLVRKLPCHANHIFHSKCILDWFAVQQRCPLCTEFVSSAWPTLKPYRSDPRTSQLALRRRFRDRASSVRQRLTSSFRRHSSMNQPSPSDAPIIQQPGLPAPPNNSRIVCPSGPPLEEDRYHSSPVLRTELHQDRSREDRAQDCNADLANNPRGMSQQRIRGPRTYSYIVHDNVRMEMNPYIPV